MKVITIGRSQENNIVVNNDKVSRVHMQIVQHDDGSYSVVDLKSTNGTLVNGQRITGEVHLQPNDVVQIGSKKLPWLSYFAPEILVTPPPPFWTKRKILIAVVSAMLLAGASGVYLKIVQDKKIEQVRIEEEKRDIEEFNNLKGTVAGVKAAGRPIDNLLPRMIQIAEKYPDNMEMQEIIRELKNDR